MSRSFLVPLLLPADPTNPLEAATKQYVDAKTTGSAFFEFMFSATTTAPPTGSEIRFNNATYASVTKVWVRYLTADGVDVKNRLLFQAVSGTQFYVQDKDNSANWVLFDLTADATDQTTYAELTVTYNSGAGTIPAQRVIAGILNAPSSGGGSVEEVFVGTTEPSDPAIELWYDPDATPGEGVAEMQVWQWAGEQPAARGIGPAQQGAVATGQVATDAPPSSAAFVYISRLDSTGMIDWSETISNLPVGGLLYLQYASDATSWHRYNITGTPTEDTTAGLWTIPVVTDAGSPPGTAPPVGEPVFIMFPTGNVDWTQGYAVYDDRYINVNGDTMTGILRMRDVDIYGTDAAGVELGRIHWWGTTPSGTIQMRGNSQVELNVAAAQKLVVTAAACNLYNPTSIFGDLSMQSSGQVIIPQDPTTANHATRRSYVDTAVATKQPLDADLTAIAALAQANGSVIQSNGTAWTAATPAALKTSLTLTKTDVGLANVDNTSDTAKPVSTATQTALNLLVAKAGDTMTGALTLPGNPTQALQAAPKQYVDAVWSPGDLKATVVTVAPSGWLMMNGQAITNADTTYAALWAVVPAAWKSGTTLTLPNMTDRVTMGGGTLGAVGGNNSLTLVIANLPAHDHTMANHTHPMPHTHDVSSRVAVGTAGGAVQGAAAQSASNAVTSNLSNANTSGPSTNTTGQAGSGTAIDATSAHLRVNYMIKT